jgi:Transglutaminase-like superfamily
MNRSRSQGVVHKLKQFLRLSGSDRSLLLRIAVLLPLIELGLRLVGFSRVLEQLRRFAIPRRSTDNPAAEAERHRRLLFLFHRQLPFFGRCLARAFTLWWLLQRRGVETEMRFGVRKQDGQLTAHAWIEHNSRPLTGDPEEPLHYAVFAEPILTTSLST